MGVCPIGALNKIASISNIDQYYVSEHLMHWINIILYINERFMYKKNDFFLVQIHALICAPMGHMLIDNLLKLNVSSFVAKMNPIVDESMHIST